MFYEKRKRKQKKKKKEVIIIIILILIKSESLIFRNMNSISNLYMRAKNYVIIFEFRQNLKAKRKKKKKELYFQDLLLHKLFSYIR